jgi:hypothetical protein
MGTPEASRDSSEVILHKMGALLMYNHIGVTTLQQELPEARYELAPFNDSKQQWFTHIRHHQLRIVTGGDNSHVHSIHYEPSNGCDIELDPNKIRKVWVDHPLRQFLPLDNQVMMRVDTTPVIGGPLLRWAEGAMTLDNLQRISRYRHAEHPDIGVIEAYDISRTRGQMTIEEARMAGRGVMRFFITYVNPLISPTTSLMTMQLDNHVISKPQAVVIRPPVHATNVPPLQIEGVEVPASMSKEKTLELHKKRIKEYHPHHSRRPLHYPISDFAVDTAFVYAVHD